MNYQKLLSRFYGSEEPNKYGDDAEEFNTFQQQNQQQQQQQQQQEDPSLYAEIDSSSASWYQGQESAPGVAEPVSAEQVRWFYKAQDEKIWCEFNGFDSMLIENKYREYKGDTAKLDKVVIDQNGQRKNVHSAFNLRKCSAGKKTTKKDKEGFVNGESSPMEHHVTVRGGMFEVDLDKMICESIYWPGEQYTITRGLYFYDGSWQPVEGCFGEIIDEEHLRLFGNTNEEIEKPVQPGGVLYVLNFPEFHVEWISSSDIFLYWGGAPRQLVRSVTQKLGFHQSTGYRLKRGYRNIATAAEKPVEITHVVFVIHGIGQKMDSKRIIRNTNALRASCDWLRTQYLDGSGGESRGRAELFPASWRAGEAGDAAELLSAATPLGAPALRRAINDAAMDVMYYTSPLHGKQVQDDLTNELNRLYTMFMARNPDYKGHFSAVAHSLGCVIIYDIITGYQMGCEKCANINGSVQDASANKLLFSLQQLFCLGSPLGVFLSLREPAPGKPRILPDGLNTRLFNIFHLSDPVAYRLEPLFASWLSKIPPLVIQSHYTAPSTSPSSTQASPSRGPWKIWSLVKHPWQRSESGSPLMNNSVNPQNGAESPKKIISEFENSSTTNKHDVKQEIADELENNYNFEHSNLEESNIATNTQESSDSLQLNRNPEEVLPYRIDYTLRDSFITNNYIWAITSHTAYWNNYDIAYFILSHLLPDINDTEPEDTHNITF